MANKIIKVSGMTCSSCQTLLRNTISELDGVKSVNASYVKGEVSVKYDGRKLHISRIEKVIDDNGFTCGGGKRSGGKLTIKKDTLVTAGVLLFFIGAYFLVSSVFDFGFPVLSQDTSVMLMFFIGLVTGFHCIAMCGGFVVSYSADSKSNFMSHLKYGLSKTLSYALIGGVFGLIGSFIAFTPFIRGAAGMIAGLFLIGFGLNMLDMLIWFRRFRFRLPLFVDRWVAGKHMGNKNPVTIGLLNGLMIACGPLQAFYLMAATSGSFYWGAIYLAAFGLGTLPVLLGFGMVTSFLSSRFTARIMRYSGMLVIILGVIMVNRGLALSGIGYDITSMSVSAEVGVQQTISIDGGVQTIKMNVTRYGWEPDKFVLKKGVPVRWEINGLEINGCNNAIQVPKFGLEFPVKKGKQIIEFTPNDEGVVSWSCWMGMIPGAFVVVDEIDVTRVDEVKRELEKVVVPEGGSCGASKGGSCGCGG